MSIERSRNRPCCPTFPATYRFSGQPGFSPFACGAAAAHARTGRYPNVHLDLLTAAVVTFCSARADGLGTHAANTGRKSRLVYLPGHHHQRPRTQRRNWGSPVKGQAYWTLTRRRQTG